MDNPNDLWRHVDASKERFIDLSDRVWAIPEVCYTEKRSVAEHVAELQHQGFRITQNVADIPTAVIGEAGEGGPVIAFLGEYDALPGLSQESGVARHSEIETGGLASSGNEAAKLAAKIGPQSTWMKSSAVTRVSGLLPTSTSFSSTSNSRARFGRCGGL